MCEPGFPFRASLPQQLVQARLAGHLGHVQRQSLGIDAEVAAGSLVGGHHPVVAIHQQSHDRRLLEEVGERLHGGIWDRDGTRFAPPPPDHAASIGTAASANRALTRA